ncbi:MAG: hypothetical protein ABJF50_24425 [Paracoccaceae bacterium]
MFIRYQGISYDDCSRGYIGLFQSAGSVGNSDAQSWQLSEIRRECAWFNEHLGFPRRLYYRPYSKGEISGLCWFRATASEYVARARYLAWLLNDIGVFIEEQKSLTPGRVVWQDDHQIVAIKRLES